MANCLTALAGFFLASKGKSLSFTLLIATIGAIVFGMIAVCIANNYIDRGIDSKMDRTKKRVLVTGDISPKIALFLAISFAAVSMILFILFTNLLTLAVGAVGVFFYLVLYSICKRHSPWSTLIGSIPGAVVPVAGYAAVTRSIDLGAMLLFFMLIFWQMPHFYAIAIYRRKEYKNAHLPVLPVAWGIGITKVHILFYCIAFVFVMVMLYITGITSSVYLIVMLTMSVLWVFYGLKGFFAKTVDRWARNMFFFSLVINMLMSTMLIVDYFVR